MRAIVAVGCDVSVAARMSVGGTCVGVSVGPGVKVGKRVSVGRSGVSVEPCASPDWDSGSVGGTDVSVGAGVAVGGTGVFVGTVVFDGVAVAGGAHISLIVITGGGFPGPQDQPSTAPLITG